MPRCAPSAARTLSMPGACFALGRSTARTHVSNVPTDAALWQISHAAQICRNTPSRPDTMTDSDISGRGQVMSGPLTEEERFALIREVWRTDVAPPARTLAECPSFPPGMSLRDASAYAAQVIEHAIDQLRNHAYYLYGLRCCDSTQAHRGPRPMTDRPPKPDTPPFPAVVGVHRATVRYRARGAGLDGKHRGRRAGVASRRNETQSE